MDCVVVLFFFSFKIIKIIGRGLASLFFLEYSGERKSACIIEEWIPHALPWDMHGGVDQYLKFQSIPVLAMMFL